MTIDDPVVDPLEPTQDTVQAAFDDDDEFIDEYISSAITEDLERRISDTDLERILRDVKVAALARTLEEEKESATPKIDSVVLPLAWKAENAKFVADQEPVNRVYWSSVNVDYLEHDDERQPRRLFRYWFVAAGFMSGAAFMTMSALSLVGAEVSASAALVGLLYVLSATFVVCTLSFLYVARRLTLEKRISLAVQGTIREASREVWRNPDFLAASVLESISSNSQPRLATNLTHQDMEHDASMFVRRSKEPAVETGPMLGVRLLRPAVPQ